MSPWRTWPLSSKLFSRKIIPFGFGFKNCIANIFLFVKCRLCTRAEFKVSFYISEVSPLVISKYKNMQENYERWKMIIMIKRILYSELQLHVGRNTKPYRKKYKTQQEEKQNATRKKTKPCRKKNKTMQEEFQNHTRRNAKPFKKKCKAIQEEIQSHARRNTKPCQKKYKIQREDQQQASGTARPINQNRPLPTMTVCVQCTHTLHYHHQGLEY